MDRQGGVPNYNSPRLLVDEETQDLQLTNCRLTENLCATARGFHEPARNGTVLRPQRRGCAGRTSRRSIFGIYVGIPGIHMFSPVRVFFAHAAASCIPPTLKKLGQRVKADESLRRFPMHSQVAGCVFFFFRPASSLSIRSSSGL